MEARSDDVKVDVDALATELRNMMSEKALFWPSSCCIFQVPSILSRHNPMAYKPDAFSIGPFHYKKSPLIEATQKIKLKYLNGLVSSERPWPGTNDADPDAKLKALSETVSGVQKEARECYAGCLSLSASEFTQVLVLDGCFLVELFRKKSNGNLVEADDPVFSMSCLLQYLYHDLILLENQIPWGVLELIFDMTKPIDIGDQIPLVKLVVDFFGNIFQYHQPPCVKPLLSNAHGSKHILDLLRNSLLQDFGVRPTNDGIENHNDVFVYQPMPSATSLREAGIKFSCDLSSPSILAVKFIPERVLKIPPLFIQETTETVLRNLICLEQCCPNYEPVVTSYAIMMDNLINTKADMEILTKSRVINNWLNIEDATNFFNNLYDDTYIKDNYYHRLTREVAVYCERSWPRWRRVLMHDYFRHPWMLISVVAAAVLLVFAFLQTLFTIIQK